MKLKLFVIRLQASRQERFNQIEDWRIINQASMDHPFHLHANRFQVVNAMANQ